MHEMHSSVGRTLTTLKSPQDQIAEFLGTKLPQDFVLSDTDQVSLLDYDPDIVGLIRERRPAIWIDRCVAIKRANGIKPLVSVWGTTTFTEQMVAGHFPGRPVVPFIYLVWQIAQCACIASALQVNDQTKAPLGIGSDGSNIDADDIIDAPAKILASVRIEASKFNICKFAASSVYRDGTKVGTVNGIKYFLRPSPDIPFT